MLVKIICIAWEYARCSECFPILTFEQNPQEPDYKPTERSARPAAIPETLLRRPALHASHSPRPGAYTGHLTRPPSFLEAPRCSASDTSNAIAALFGAGSPWRSLPSGRLRSLIFQSRFAISSVADLPFHRFDHMHDLDAVVTLHAREN